MPFLLALLGRRLALRQTDAAREGVQLDQPLRQFPLGRDLRPRRRHVAGNTRHGSAAALPHELGVQHREASDPHVPTNHLRLALHGVLREVPQQLRADIELVGDDFARHIGKATKWVFRRIAVERMERVEVQAHVRRALAVEAREEVLQQFLLRQLGVPHPLRLEPRLEFGELGVLPLVGALLVDVAHLVLAEEAEVVLQAQHVGERGRVVGEVRAVIPDVHLLADRPPALDVVHELDVLLVGALRDRVREVALDGAEAGHHVRARLDVLRRLARVLVGERLDDHVGELLLDGLGDLVDEGDHRAGVRLLAVVDLLALRTGAEVVPVVLADAVKGGAGILADAREDVGGDDAQDVRIRETELRAVLQALSVHLAEVFGVLIEILGGWTEQVERVAGMQSAAVAVRRAAVLRLERHPLAAVHAVAAGEVRIADHVRPERLAHQKGGFLRVVERVRHGERLDGRHLLAPAGVPAAAAVPFQQFVHAVQHAAVASRLHQQAVPLHGEVEGVARKVLSDL